MDERLRRDGAIQAPERERKRERAAPRTQCGCVVTTEPRTGRQQYCLTRDLAPVAPSAHSTHSTLRRRRALCSAYGWFPIIFRHLVDTDWTGPYLWPSCRVCVGVGVRACVRVRGHIGVTLQSHHQCVHAHGPTVEELLSRILKNSSQPLDVSRRVRLCSAVKRHRKTVHADVLYRLKD